MAPPGFISSLFLMTACIQKGAIQSKKQKEFLHVLMTGIENWLDIDFLQTIKTLLILLSFRGKAVPLPRVSQTLHAQRSPLQTHQNSHE